jgi:LmbE family N-acetylglucosaminyl deacetylase
MGTNNIRIMVLGGHPADVFDHCGGTLAHHVRKGDQVTCVALTQGLRIHDEVVSEVFRFGTEGYKKEEIERICAEREQVKLKEVKDACALFGVTDVRSLRYDDKLLLVTGELIDAVAKLIREVKPHLIITHYPKSSGNTIDHHGNAAKIAIAAAMLAGTVDFEDPNPAWRIVDFAFMLNPGDLTAFQALDSGVQAVPNYFVDVTDVVDLKVKALDMMRSQQYQGKYARKNVETWSGGLGYGVRRPYCEAFVLNKPVVADTIELCEHWIERSNEPEKNKMNRDFEMTAPFEAFTQ